MWRMLVGFLIIGYFSMGRSFAYLGFPAAKLFIGEIALGLFIVLKPRVALATLTHALFRPSPINELGFGIFVFLLFGICQVVRGLASGGGLDVLKYFVFNYYVFYIFFGLWIGIHHPNFLASVLRALAWFNGFYGLAYLLVLKDIPLTLFGSGVALFGQPNGSGVALLGLICFERNLIRVSLPLILNITVLLGTSVRAEWFALAITAMLWGLLKGRFLRILGLGLVGMGLVWAISLADIQISGRAAVSPEVIISRAIAPFNKELAAEFSPNAAEDAGTTTWRMLWWEQIWKGVNSDTTTTLFGYGYGFDLFSLAPEQVRSGQAQDIRTPHSVFYYALGYTGWVGVALFALLQASIARLQWRAFRKSGQPFGLLWWLAGLLMAFISNFFETPFQSIPFYLIMGMTMAPVFWLNCPPGKEDLPVSLPYRP
jgi:hypothetical protein